jgi:hypothetical protein
MLYFPDDILATSLAKAVLFSVIHLLFLIINLKVFSFVSVDTLLFLSSFISVLIKISENLVLNSSSFVIFKAVT